MRTKIFSETVWNNEYWTFALFDSKQSNQGLQNLLTLSDHLKYAYSTYLLRVGLFCIMLHKMKHFLTFREAAEIKYIEI